MDCEVVQLRDHRPLPRGPAERAGGRRACSAALRRQGRSRWRAERRARGRRAARWIAELFNSGIIVPCPGGRLSGQVGGAHAPRRSVGRGGAVAGRAPCEGAQGSMMDCGVVQLRDHRPLPRGPAERAGGRRACSAALRRQGRSRWWGELPAREHRAARWIAELFNSGIIVPCSGDRRKRQDGGARLSGAGSAGAEPWRGGLPAREHRAARWIAELFNSGTLVFPSGS